MPRLPRVSVEGALYCVTAYSEPALHLFYDQKDVETYLQLLSQYKTQHGFKLFAYALLADQLYLCFQVGAQATLPEIMHDLNSRYTKLYCKRYQLTGHLFKGRYKATVVEKELYLARITRFIHLQPAALANSLPDYRMETPSIVDTTEVLSRFPGENTRKSYEIFLQAAVAEEMEQMHSELQKPFIGSPEFVEILKQCSKMSLSSKETSAPDEPEAQALPVRLQKGWHPWQFFNMIAMVGFLSALLGQGPTSGTGMMLMEKRVNEVIHRAAPTAPATKSVLPAHQLAVFPSVPSYLQGTTWDIKIRPGDGAGNPSVQTDHLQFDGRKVTSSQLNTEGFSASNYTVTFKTGGSFVWETMQTGPQGEVICWRGESNGQTMRGVMTRQAPGMGAINFNFIGVSYSPTGNGIHKTSET